MVGIWIHTENELPEEVVEEVIVTTLQPVRLLGGKERFGDMCAKDGLE